MIKTGRALSIVLMLAASAALGLSTLFLLVVGFCGGFPPGTGGLAFIALMIMIGSLATIVALIRAEQAGRGEKGPRPRSDGE